jgi:hypothetical protein
MHDAAIRCGSWLVYATRGRSFTAICVRYVTICVKWGRVEWSSGRAWADLMVDAIGAQAPDNIRQLFASPVTLVPVPQSGVSTQTPTATTTWPSDTLCQAFCRCGLGDEVQKILRRAQAVPKAAWHRRNRPDVDMHYRSFESLPATPTPQRLLLIDDVVTRGATLMGAARRLRETFPGVPIEAFALARVQGAGDIDRAAQPAIEWITRTPTGCVRLPATFASRSMRKASTVAVPSTQKLPDRGPITR